jgi:hypothetical protein
MGLALTIGLNFVDPNHYSGWDGQLTACEFDAEDMTEIAKSKGFEVQSLLTKKLDRILYYIDKGPLYIF